MANRRDFQTVHRGGEISRIPRTAGMPVPLVGADTVPGLTETDTVLPLAEDEGILAATGEIQVEPVMEPGAPVSDPMNSEPLYA